MIDTVRSSKEYRLDDTFQDAIAEFVTKSEDLHSKFEDSVFNSKKADYIIQTSQFIAAGLTDTYTSTGRNKVDFDKIPCKIDYCDAVRKELREQSAAMRRNLDKTNIQEIYIDCYGPKDYSDRVWPEGNFIAFLKTNGDKWTGHIFPVTLDGDVLVNADVVIDQDEDAGFGCPRFFRFENEAANVSRFKSEVTPYSRAADTTVRNASGFDPVEDSFTECADKIRAASDARVDDIKADFKRIGQNLGELANNSGHANTDFDEISNELREQIQRSKKEYVSNTTLVEKTTQYDFEVLEPKRRKVCDKIKHENERLQYNELMSREGFRITLKVQTPGRYEYAHRHLSLVAERGLKEMIKIRPSSTDESDASVEAQLAFRRILYVDEMNAHLNTEPEQCE